MKSRAELLREAADHPERLVEYISTLQEQLGQQAEQLAQAQALIAELKRELFGAKADQLNAEQEQQLSRNHAVATTKYTKYTKGNGSRAGG